MTETARRRARKQPAEVRREEIIDAAVRVFARTSFRAAGTIEIARAAGVAEPTIYRHFASKRDLYLAALERSASVVLEAWREIIARYDRADEALDRIGGWYDANARAHSDLLRLRHRAAAETDDADVRDLLRRGYTDVHDLLTRLIRRGQRQGVFADAVDAEGAAWLFCGIGQILDLGVLTGIETTTRAGCMDRVASVFMRALVAPAS